MTIKEMHLEFKWRYNKLDSNHKKDLTPYEIDALLNDAIHSYEEIFWSGNNSKRFKLGFEVTQQRIDMLSTLVVGQPEQPSLSPVVSDTTLNIYEYDLSDTVGDLIEPYSHLVRAYATVEGCDTIFNVKLEQHDDLNRILKDDFRKPSKSWRRLPGVLKRSSDPTTETSLYLYTNGEFEIENLYVEYIKEAVKVSLGGYTDVNGDVTVETHCDLPAHYHTMVVDIAVQEIARRLEDGNRFQLKQEKIITNS